MGDGRWRGGDGEGGSSSIYLNLGQSRLLEVDNRVILLAKSRIKFIVTSVDVPHS